MTPLAAMSAKAIQQSLASMAAHDVQWTAGRVFSLAYDAGPEVRAVADQAYATFSSANALNTDAFPSLRQMQADVVSIVQHWVHAPDTSAGFMTSGGTESILMAVKAARERGRRELGITQPNMVLATSAHAAFDKAAYYFGLECRRAEVDSQWQADPAGFENLIDANTVLLVGSAPQYPQGVLDPIPAIASLGRDRNINVHVDACMGGVTLPYLERAGEIIAPWDFRVPGVTSISVDLHKYGYTAKGASVIVYCDKVQRSYQTFVTSDWLGGTYGSSGVLGTKSGGPIAAAWAVLHYLGDEGYLRLTRDARATCLRLAAAITDIAELELRADPVSTLVSFGIAPDAASSLNIDDVNQALRERQWYVDRQGPPPSLHCTVHAGHVAIIEEFISDLHWAVEIALATTLKAKTDSTSLIDSADSTGSYGTIE